MSDSENIQANCPYCNAQVDNNIEQCPNCGEWFKAPHLDEFKIVSLNWHIVLLCLTLGLYNMIWVILNRRAFIHIATPKDTNKLILLVYLMVFSILIIPPFNIIMIYILYGMTAYRLLRIIEKHSLKKYNAPITHHELGMAIFNILYVVYFIDTFELRVNNPTLRYNLSYEKWVKYGTLLIILATVLFLAAFLFNKYFFAI